MATTAKPSGPITVQWAFVVGVDSNGRIYLIDHEFVHEVKARRAAVLDDIYAASFVTTRVGTNFAFYEPGDDVYALAFLVFQMPDGYIAASPDIFDNIVPVTSPSDVQVLGAFGVLQGQIIAQRAADMAAQVAVQATLSVIKGEAQKVKAEQNRAEGKSEGGLIVA